jgi:crotonobetaine/carnitine-CoA ligase
MYGDEQILANLIRRHAATEPDLDVLTFVDVARDGRLNEEIRTYRQLWQNGQRAAEALKAHGLKTGDTFAVVMDNHPEFVDLMVASSILGTVFVPIDPRTRGDKLRYMLDFAECKGAVVADGALDEVRAAWGKDSGHWIMSLAGGAGAGDSGPTMRDVLGAALPVPPIDIASMDPAATMQILYTSGTTGDPKAILTSHAKFATGSTVGQILGLTRADRPYTGLSLTHANAQVITLGMTLSMGMRGVISRRFTKSRLWDITRRYGCTLFNLLGGMTTALYAEPRRSDDRDNPVRTVLSAGMPAAIWEDFARRFDVTISEFYGAAEGGLTFNVANAGPVGSCGKAPPNLELAILNESGGRCAPAGQGEICFRNVDGSAPAVRYLKNPEATARKTTGGWLHMGDIGHLDAHGWLFFDYRMGGGIRRNGDFINTAFVEKAIAELDAVADVYVYGVPLPGMAPGEKEVVAAIVASDPARFDAEQVFAVCREKLDANCVPRFLQLVDEIPKTASEKPQERFLLQSFDVAAANIHTATPR